MNRSFLSLFQTCRGHGRFSTARRSPGNLFTAFPSLWSPPSPPLFLFLLIRTPSGGECRRPPWPSGSKPLPDLQQYRPLFSSPPLSPSPSSVVTNDPIQKAEPFWFTTSTVQNILNCPIQSSSKSHTNILTLSFINHNLQIFTRIPKRRNSKLIILLHNMSCFFFDQWFCLLNYDIII